MLNIKIQKLGKVFWIWILFVVGVCVALIFNFTQNGSLNLSGNANTIISLVFFTVAFFLFFLAASSLRDGLRISVKIANMTEQIRKLKEDGCKAPNIMGRIRDGQLTFDELTLDAALDQYKADVEDMLKASESTYLDIDAYINNSVIDKKIKTHFLNQISGTMTGLGILGTFIGLSVGLNSFSLSGTSADITNQIQPLMEGIKVAFHTSIYGLIYSIGFNFIYRICLEMYHGEMDRFLTVFRQYVVPISDNGSESTVIKYQKKMEELLEKQLNETIRKNEADTERGNILNRNIDKMQEAMFGTKDLVENLREDMTDSLGRVMTDTVVPEIHKMGQIVEEFAKSTRKDQGEELSRLVDAFIQDMNKALGSSFKDLESIIKETNEWQKRSLEELQNVLDKVQDTTIDLTNIDELIQKAIECVSDYTIKVEKMQEAANANLESLNVQCDQNNEIIRSQTQKLTEINEKQALMQNDMAKAMGQTEELIEKITKYAEESYSRIGELSKDVLSNISQQIESVNQFDSQTLEDLSNAADRLGTAAEKLSEQMHEKIKDTFVTFDQQLANIVSHLAGVLQQMEKVSKNTKTSYDGISLEIEDNFKTLQEKLEQYLECADKLHHDISTKWDMFRQISFEEK